MANKENPKRKEALKLWLESGRTLKPREIATVLGVSSSQISKWKSLDKWKEIPLNPKRGAPYGNSNAVGNSGNPNASAPTGNQNAFKHGLSSKYLPDDEEYLEIYNSAIEGLSTLDILYEQIILGRTNLIRAQKIMYVKDIDDITKEVKKEKSYRNDTSSSNETEYEIQQAWDKQASALTAQATATKALLSNIKQYEEMIRSMDPKDVHERHKAQLKQVKLQQKKLQADIKKTQAEADIAKNKADKLTASGESNKLLQALIDVRKGGNGSGGVSEIHNE